MSTGRKPLPRQQGDHWGGDDGPQVWLSWLLLLIFGDFSGPAYDLTFCEVRDTSLVMLWKAPVYSGSSPVSGYFVDFKEEDSGEWKTTSEATTPNRYLKVTVSLFVCVVLILQQTGPKSLGEPVLTP